MIPLRISDTLERTPWMNWLLIAGTSAISIWLFDHQDSELFMKYFVYSDRYPLSVLGSIFTHADYLHLFGNMLFLWVFGNGVCSMVGNFTYGGLYLALGVLAAWTHKLIDGDPLIGASGAIFGIVGLAVAIFPFARVSMFVLLSFIPRIWKVRLWVVALYWAATDVARVYFGGGNIASWAHLGGVGGGVAIGLAMLAIGYVKLTHYDEASLLDILLRRKQADIDQQRGGRTVPRHRVAEPTPAGWNAPVPLAERPKLKLRNGAGAAARDSATSSETAATTETVATPETVAAASAPATALESAPATAEAETLPKLSLRKRAAAPAPAENTAPARSSLKLATEPAPAAADSALASPLAPESAPAPSEAPAITAADCFIFDGTNRIGPMTAAAAQRRICDAADTANWMFWQHGMSGWQPVAGKPLVAESRPDSAVSGVGAFGAA